ncbi:MAG: hypothetical protein QOF98_1931, partial [Streptomyces sp.]|nr:hypothetical protein [Streptomyces sp.]
PSPYRNAVEWMVRYSVDSSLIGPPAARPLPSADPAADPAADCERSRSVNCA